MADDFGQEWGYCGTTCPYCGGTNTVYIGIDDGLGDYGDCIGDVYECTDCDLEFEGHTIPYSELDEGEVYEEGQDDLGFPIMRPKSDPGEI